MKKQNGMTIIEVLLSVVIIGIVLLLLFSLLIQVRNEDNENNIQSNFIINQSKHPHPNSKIYIINTSSITSSWSI